MCVPSRQQIQHLPKKPQEEDAGDQDPSDEPRPGEQGPQGQLQGRGGDTSAANSKFWETLEDRAPTSRARGVPLDTQKGMQLECISVYYNIDGGAGSICFLREGPHVRSRGRGNTAPHRVQSKCHYQSNQSEFPESRGARGSPRNPSADTGGPSGLVC
ncbi:uncharacterized protein LOC113205937 [Frankliniella occidentalis]|uniref:Uncharacterized protein LOC113205937 n=1 Tax=Frankliniella occidentalis TaxID=133901 RepID=A0A9C6XAW9_FRAOC|nr:uncharacterized protein LOC113205937 [Frankliniella occidentalis]